MVTLKHDNFNDVVREFVYPIPLTGDQNLLTLLDVVSSENDRIDDVLQDLYDQRFLTDATGQELEKIAFEVGVRRESGETDEELRRRVFSEYAAQSSDASYDSFATAALNILDTNRDNVDIETPPRSTEKTVTLFVESSVLDDSPLTNDQITSFLEGSNSAGAAVTLSVMGDFAFDGDDTSLKGWNDGTWSDIT